MRMARHRIAMSAHKTGGRKEAEQYVPQFLLALPAFNEGKIRQPGEEK
jgi:hypothetical protein